jgi:glycosyltransferase involved in cell wall biosynthesis
MFSIITPSFRGGSWLRLCVASVADQREPAEHIVQDAGSDDGTLDWLPSDPRVKAFVEKDQGMYDAINRGLRHSQGELLAWLNCDEQYLPGALKRVGAFFEQHQEIDVFFGDVVMVDSQGKYLCHRKMQTPLKYHTWTCHLSTLSCGMFFRRRVVFDYGFWFDPASRAGGDGAWMVQLLNRGVKMAALGEFTSVFTKTGSNIGDSTAALQESLELRRTAPFWAQQLRPLWIAHHRLRRLLGGMYSQKPFGYNIYTLSRPNQRQHFEVSNPVFR